MKVLPFLVTTSLLIYIIIQQKKIMAKQEQFNDMLTRLDSATTEIANDLKALRDELGDTISQESLDTLNSNITKLEDLGKDPENPVPEETPE